MSLRRKPPWMYDDGLMPHVRRGKHKINNGQADAAAANHAITMAAINLRETIASENSTTRQLGPSQHATYRHREMVGWLREEWPDLWEAIDRLVATTKGYRT